MTRERPNQPPFEFMKPAEGKEPYEPTVKEEHERLTEQYGEGAGRAPLSGEAARIVKEKRIKKVREMVRQVTEPIQKKEAEEKKERLQKKIRKILAE